MFRSDDGLNMVSSGNNNAEEFLYYGKRDLWDAMHDIPLYEQDIAEARARLEKGEPNISIIPQRVMGELALYSGWNKLSPLAEKYWPLFAEHNLWACAEQDIALAKKGIARAKEKIASLSSEMRKECISEENFEELLKFFEEGGDYADVDVQGRRFIFKK